MQRLTPRRLKIINLFKQRKTLVEIGNELGISRQAGYIKSLEKLKPNVKSILPEKGKFFVYFVELWYDTKKGRKHHIYVGQTQNLRQRWEHYLTSNQGAVAKLRNKNGTMRLAYFEEVSSRSDAVKLERAYKLLPLKEKVEIVSQSQQGRFDMV